MLLLYKPAPTPPPLHRRSPTATHPRFLFRRNAMAAEPAKLPEGIFSLLDTDLYKLTMQCCILKFFPDVSVTYGFTNRTPDKKLNRAAFQWLQAQVASRYSHFRSYAHANLPQSSRMYLFLRKSSTFSKTTVPTSTRNTCNSSPPFVLSLRNSSSSPLSP